MADPSRAPTCAQYRVEPYCTGCGRRLRANRDNGEPLWFTGLPAAGVFGECCFHLAPHWKGSPP